eukprot:gene26074-31486_t
MANSVWPEYPYDLDQELSMFKAGEIRHLLYFIGLPAQPHSFLPELVQNLTDQHVIRWKNTHCFDVAKVVGSEETENRDKSEDDGAIHSRTTNKIYRAITKITSPKPDSPMTLASFNPHLVVLDNIDAIPADQVRELDFLFRLNDAASPLSSPPLILLMTSKTITPSNANDMTAFPQAVVEYFHHPEQYVNSAALVGRFHRIAYISETLSPSPPDHSNTAKPICAFINQQRRVARQQASDLARQSQFQQMDFSTVLALLSIPVILYYLYKRLRRGPEIPTLRREESEFVLRTPPVVSSSSRRSSPSNTGDFSASSPNYMLQGFGADGVGGLGTPLTAFNDANNTNDSASNSGRKSANKKDNKYSSNKEGNGDKNSMSFDVDDEDLQGSTGRNSEDEAGDGEAASSRNRIAQGDSENNELTAIAITRKRGRNRKDTSDSQQRRRSTERQASPRPKQKESGDMASPSPHRYGLRSKDKATPSSDIATSEKKTRARRKQS